MQRVTAWLEAPPRTAEMPAGALSFDHAALARALGYMTPEPRLLPAHVQEAIDRLRPVAIRLISGRATWAAVPGQVFGELVVCDRPRGSRLAVGAIVGRQLRRSRALLVFVATIGDGLEREARRLMTEEDPLDGFILDALGSVAVEALADAVLADATREVEELGWQFTNRYSPGYCTWDTADQYNLFALLPHGPAGVRLSTSGLMQPLKSISGVVGVGPEVRYAEYSCAFCGMEDCRQRLVTQSG